MCSGDELRHRKAYLTDVSDEEWAFVVPYLWLELDGEVYLVNEVMARSGYASLSTYPPDVQYVEQIREAAAFARTHGNGLWSGCPDAS